MLWVRSTEPQTEEKAVLSIWFPYKLPFLFLKAEPGPRPWAEPNLGFSLDTVTFLHV